MIRQKLVFICCLGLVVPALFAARLSNPFQFMKSASNAENTRNVNLNDFNFQESYKVTGFTPDTQDTYTGYISVRQNTNSKLFYMLHSIQNGNITTPAPLVIWLQGGPGCSSVFGNLYEIGPVDMTFDNTTKTGSYKPKAVTWTDSNHVLFIDSPIGVGFSVWDPADPAINSTDQVASDLQLFLTRFFEIYPQFLTNDLYIFGESYAGHYVPAIAALLVANQSESGISLTGIGIGNGLVDPISQMDSWDLYTFSNGLMSSQGGQNMSIGQSQALRYIRAGDNPSCSNAVDDVLGAIDEVNPGINIYNFRQYNYEVGSDLEPWANSQSTRTLLNVPTTMPYEGCVSWMYANFLNDICRSYRTNLEFVAERIKVIIYNGQDDILVNTPGVETYIRNMQVSFREDLMRTSKQLWLEGGNVAGTIMNVGQFWYAIVNAAGHMAPNNQPQSSRALLRHFQNGDSVWV